MSVSEDDALQLYFGWTSVGVLKKVWEDVCRLRTGNSGTRRALRLPAGSGFDLLCNELKMQAWYSTGATYLHLPYGSERRHKPK